jgi:hypothetical protein
MRAQGGRFLNAPSGIPGWSGLSADLTLLLDLDSLGARGRPHFGDVRGLTATRYDVPVFRLAMVNCVPIGRESSSTRRR